MYRAKVDQLLKEQQPANGLEIQGWAVVHFDEPQDEELTKLQLEVKLKKVFHQIRLYMLQEGLKGVIYTDEVKVVEVES